MFIERSSFFTLVVTL
ncbi:hypothetical protein LINPERPRIM_LOCUS23483 [Linum perenne]